MNKIKVGNIPINGLFIYNKKFWRSDGKMTIGSDDITAYNRSERIILPYDFKVIQYKGKDEQDEDYMRVLRTVDENSVDKYKYDDGYQEALKRELQDDLIELGLSKYT